MVLVGYPVPYRYLANLVCLLDLISCYSIYFRRRLKTEPFERSYNWHSACQTTLLLRDSLSLPRSFLLWPQPWSLSTIMLLWHSFLIIIIIIINDTNSYNLEQINSAGTYQHSDSGHCDGSQVYIPHTDHCWLQYSWHTMSDKLANNRQQYLPTF